MIVAIFNPPFLSESFTMVDMGNQKIYVLCSETIMVYFNMLRLYLIWRDSGLDVGRFAETFHFGGIPAA